MHLQQQNQKPNQDFVRFATAMKLASHRLIAEEFRHRFDCEKYVRLTQQERRNLIYLKIFRNLQWFIEQNKLTTGDSFGALALKCDNPREERHHETIITVQQTGIVLLERERFVKVLNRLKV